MPNDPVSRETVLRHLAVSWQWPPAADRPGIERCIGPQAGSDGTLRVGGDNPCESFSGFSLAHWPNTVIGFRMVRRREAPTCPRSVRSWYGSEPMKPGQLLSPSGELGDFPGKGHSSKR